MKLVAGLEVEVEMNQELLIQQTKVESQALETFRVHWKS